MTAILQNGLVQTALVISAPYLVPKGIRLVQSFLNPAPKGSRAPAHPAFVNRPPPRMLVDSPRLAIFRLFLVALGVSVAVFSALSPPHNLFLSLSTPHSFLSSLFPTLRHPLDIRLATETLARAWSHSLGRPLSEPELALASRLQTLDARLAYIAYGAGPLMQCAWCRPPGTASAAGLLGTDYLLAIAPGTAVACLTALTGCGLLLSGNGRERWRAWMVLAVVTGAGVEVWKRLTWDGARGGVGGKISMLHSELHLARALFFTVLLVLSFLAPPATIPSPPPSASSLLAPAISAISAQTEGVLDRLRALSLQRMAILHKEEFREQVTTFWTSAAHDSSLARSDPQIQDVLETQFRVPGGPTEQFEKWLMSSLGPVRVQVRHGGAEGEREDEEESEGGEGEEVSLTA
ncbi:RHTO0S01e01640g1_1 [Rhodotorula toruloides]|uniref:RHTO0S01e01640g1_1 n=2 Tax=Rhodotorula toruloides TaxID=5286 RepID=A0A061AJQ8_RHOTO|nr:RHTO0S01e01640g1_1 [Rhodotorula toruloides]